LAKYSNEFKIEVVKAYINGEGGYTYLAEKFNIPSRTVIKNWVASYINFGEE
jgi:transposase-like protein